MTNDTCTTDKSQNSVIYCDPGIDEDMRPATPFELIAALLFWMRAIQAEITKDPSKRVVDAVASVAEGLIRRKVADEPDRPGFTPGAVEAGIQRIRAAIDGANRIGANDVSREDFLRMAAAYHVALSGMEHGEAGGADWFGSNVAIAIWECMDVTSRKVEEPAFELMLRMLRDCTLEAIGLPLIAEALGVTPEALNR